MLKIVFEFFTVYDQIWCVKGQVWGSSCASASMAAAVCIGGGRREIERDRWERGLKP
jgi:hypothetical protein